MPFWNCWLCNKNASDWRLLAGNEQEKSPGSKALADLAYWLPKDICVWLEQRLTLALFGIFIQSLAQKTLLLTYCRFSLVLIDLLLLIASILSRLSALCSHAFDVVVLLRDICLPSRAVVL